MPLFSLQMDSLVPFPLVLAQFVLVHIRGKYNQIFLLWLLLAELVGCLFCRTVGLTVAMMMTSWLSRLNSVKCSCRYILHSS